MCSCPLVSMSTACSQIKLSCTIHSAIQPDLLKSDTTCDGQRDRKRLLVPTRWMSPLIISLRIPQLPIRSVKPRIIRLMDFTLSVQPIDASDIDGAVETDAWDSVVSKISVDIASTMRACVEGRLIPLPVLFWLRSRLATEEECSVSTVLTQAWWRGTSIKNPSADQINIAVENRRFDSLN